MIPFDENGFREAAETVLKPWVDEHVTSSRFISFDGTGIQYYKAVRPDARAVIVMVHGFCEFFGKYHETAYNFWENGYTIYFIEQRGHGGSGDPEAPDVVDVEDFSEYVEDLKCFLDKVVIPETPGIRIRADIHKDRKAGKRLKNGEQGEGNPLAGGGKETQTEGRKQNLILYSHSMGGCVSALFLERYPEYFCAAVLSSPMLKMAFGQTPQWQGKLFLLASKVRGWKEELMPGMDHFDPDKPDFEGSGMCSPSRYEYQFSMRKDPSTGGRNSMNAATWNWGRAAMKATLEAAEQMDQITIPVLLCQAGRDTFVDNEGQEEFARNVKHVKLVRFPSSKHEIYAGDTESMKLYYQELFRFFRKAGAM